MTPSSRIFLLSKPKPTLDLQFASGFLDPRITATGGTNGTVINSAGVIALASAPRFDYSATTLAAKGVLIEEQRINVLLNSLINGTSLSTQSVTTTAQAYTLSFYGTGTVTLSGAFVGSLVGSGAYPTRSTLTFTSTAASLTLTVSGSVQYAQLEAGSQATSFIPTAGTAVTRAIDILTMSDLSWFNNMQGMFVIEFDSLVSGTAGAAYGVVCGGASARFAYISSGQHGITSYDGTTLLTNTGTVTDGAQHKVTSSYVAATTRSVAIDSAAPVLNATCAAAYTAPVALYLGAVSAGGSAPLNGHLARVRYWPRAQ